MPGHASAETYEKCLRVLHPILLLAPRTYLDELRARMIDEGVRAAVLCRDSAVLFDWIVRLLARQGIGNHAAEVFLARRGSPTFAEIADLISGDARCPRLRCHWSFEGCGYRRSTVSCRTPHHIVGCPATRIPVRKGALAEAAVGLWLFIRDCGDGNLVGWIDQQLARADAVDDQKSRAARMRTALLDPLAAIPGTGRKTWSMILAQLLLGADPGRERWVLTGASFVAIDSLVHNLLARTGILRRLQAEHPYGPRCYASGGCADVIAELAIRIDAHEFNPAYPAVFPRWIQYALWLFAAAEGWSTCTGSRIDDRTGCQQKFCPSFATCDQLPLASSRFDGSD